MFQSTKSYFDYPCAHRQHRHQGNCALVHGYSRSFHFVFAAQTADSCGFIVDYGKLKWVKAHLDHMFDHTLLLNPDDPLLSQFQEIEKQGGAAIRIMPYGVGMEGTAQYLCEYVDERLRVETQGRCWVVSVESRENPKNSSIYFNPQAGFKGWL
jgi:6-pyruvoyltetrahydropterin/6-carboxytetrahydropterin synthase